MKKSLTRSCRFAVALVLIVALASAAAFAATPTEWKDPSEFTNVFNDVRAGDWYYDNVAFVVSNGLIPGVTATEFAPNTKITWGMLVTALYELAGKTDINASLAGAVDDKWNADAAAWVVAASVTEVMGENLLAPDAEMTREQLTAVIYRYAKHIGIAPEGAWVIHMDFTDIADVSDWAAEAMMYCVSKGIISGRPGGLLDPQGQATRAEAAAVLHRFAQTLE